MNRLRDHRDDLQALIGSAAAQLGIDQVFVEKDFWVTEVLRAATVPVVVLGKDGSHHPVGVVFKGGTSLSRVFGIIARFSEDVDLLIRFPAVEVSEAQRDKALKEIRDNVAAHLELVGASVESGSATRGVKRNVRYHYPESMPHPAVTAGVLLEMGCRGGAFPTSRHDVRSILADHAIGILDEDEAAWAEFEPVTVEVLAPERTLLEKLALLHDAMSRYPDEAAVAKLIRSGRHLYDVHQLLCHEPVLSALDDMGPSGVAELCADIDFHSAAAGLSYTPRPASGFRDSPLALAGHGALDVLAEGYRRTVTALVYGEKPAFDDCVAVIRAHVGRL